mgnify:FL=1
MTKSINKWLLPWIKIYTFNLLDKQLMLYKSTKNYSNLYKGSSHSSNSPYLSILKHQSSKYSHLLNYSLNIKKTSKKLPKLHKISLVQVVKFINLTSYSKEVLMKPSIKKLKSGNRKKNLSSI